MAAGEHFVDKHRLDLIDSVALIDPILDELLQQKLLTNEQYDTVASKSTPQGRMRELYRYVTPWGNSDKDKFYQALKKHDGPVIKELGDNSKCSHCTCELTRDVQRVI